MHLDDFPIGAIGELERRLTDSAGHEQTLGDQAETRNQPSAGYYRAALAYAEAARQTMQTGQLMIAHLDRRAAEQNDPEHAHTWPIPLAEKLNAVHSDPVPASDDLREEWHQRHPTWGITADAVGHDNLTDAVKIIPCTHGDGIILDVSRGNGGEDPARWQIAVNVTFDQWDALVALVARIRAGRPIPYDLFGNVRTQEPTQ